MKNYESPVVFANEELSEGVYAASGNAGGGNSSSDCWTVSGKSVQEWNGSHNVFEISAKHSLGAVHITNLVMFTFTFSSNLTDAYSEFDSTFSGNTVTVSRNLLADAYHSGDDVTFKVWVKADDEATTKALTLTGISFTCRHEENVQGGID